MAIDTALKRRSAGAVGRRVPGAGVTPDALKPVAWRQSAAWGYAGIAPAAPAVAVAGPVTKRDGIFAYATKRDGVFDRLTKRPGVLA